jgi:hypothetical protein
MHWRNSHSLAIVLLNIALASAAAHGQFAITSSTIDCGGGSSSGGAFVVTGTIGQPDAGPALTGGAFTLSGGFCTPSAACAGDFNNSGSISVQDIFDFLSAWFAALPSADFNHVNGITVQDIFDFLAAWFAGC